MVRDLLRGLKGDSNGDGKARRVFDIHLYRAGIFLVCIN